MNYFLFYLAIGFFEVFCQNLRSSDEPLLSDAENLNFNETYKPLANESESQIPSGTSLTNLTNETKLPFYVEDKPVNFTTISNEASLQLRNTDELFESEVERTTISCDNPIMHQNIQKNINSENLTLELNSTNEPLSALFLSSASFCNCLNEEANYCECGARGGIINSTYGMIGTFTYNIAIKPNEKLMVVVREIDFDLSGSENCSFEVGGELFARSSTFLKPERILLFEKSVNITEKDTGSCVWKFAYRVGRQYNESSIETSLEGTFKVPPDEDYLQLYRPMTRRLWNISPNISNCSIEVTVRGLDLGSTLQSWDELNGNETGTTADFLAIGSGNLADNESVSLQDTVLYGQSESPITFIFDACKAHVIFAADMHYQNSSGFTVQYKVIKEVVSEKRDLTNSSVNHERDNSMPSVVLYVNGVNINKDLPMANNSWEFRDCIADMANIFVERKNIEYLSINSSSIRKDDIMVYDVSMCRSSYCSEICVAYNFSVIIKKPDGSWLFTTDLLNEMFKVLELKDSWIDKKEIKICHLEIEFETTWRWIGFGGLVILLIIILAISLLFKISEAIYNESNLRTKETREGSVNYFNDHSNTSSATSIRFSLPSSRRRNNQNNVREPSEWNYNISGFEQFDPVGERVDPRSCGLDEEVVHDSTSVTFYSNSAYEVDEHELFSQAVVRSPHASNNSHSVPDNTQSQHDTYSSDESEIGDFDNNSRNLNA